MQLSAGTITWKKIAQDQFFEKGHSPISCNLCSGVCCCQLGDDESTACIAALCQRSPNSGEINDATELAGPATVGTSACRPSGLKPWSVQPRRWRVQPTELARSTTSALCKIGTVGTSSRRRRWIYGNAAAKDASNCIWSGAGDTVMSSFEQCLKVRPTHFRSKFLPG